MQKPAALLLIFLSFLGLTRAQGETVLMCSVEDVTTRLRTDGQVPMWDFSSCTMTDGNVKVDVFSFGDSLLTEAFAGRRQWLGRDGARLRWLAEETRSMDVALDSAGLDTIGPGVYFRSRGRYAGSMNIAQEGVMGTAVSRPGVLVLCDGDTLRGVVRQEFVRWCRTAMSPSDIPFPLDADSLPQITSRYVRWVFPDRPLEPVALMYCMTVADADGVAADSTAWCCMSLAQRAGGVSADEESTVNLTAEEIAALLQGVGIGSGQGEVSLSLGHWDGPEITVSVTDTYGRLYFSQTYGEPAPAIRIDVSGYNAGSYLIVLTAMAGETPVVRKELVTFY